MELDYEDREYFLLILFDTIQLLTRISVQDYWDLLEFHKQSIAYNFHKVVTVTLYSVAVFGCPACEKTKNQIEFWYGEKYTIKLRKLNFSAEKLNTFSENLTEQHFEDLWDDLYRYYLKFSQWFPFGLSWMYGTIFRWMKIESVELLTLQLTWFSGKMEKVLLNFVSCLELNYGRIFRKTFPSSLWS